MARRNVYAAVGGSYSDYRVYAIFETRELADAFVAHRESYADDVEVRRLYDAQPKLQAWHVIDKDPYDDEPYRHTLYVWDFESPPYGGYKRQSANYSKWATGERAFGRDKAAVERLWAEEHEGAH